MQQIFPVAQRQGGPTTGVGQIAEQRLVGAQIAEFDAVLLDDKPAVVHPDFGPIDPGRRRVGVFARLKTAVNAAIVTCALVLQFERYAAGHGNLYRGTLLRPQQFIKDLGGENNHFAAPVHVTFCRCTYPPA